jgi:hypothetical protein
MPAYGKVYRQPQFPILWVKGIHSPEQLTECDLQPEGNTAPIENAEIYIRSENALGNDINSDQETRFVVDKPVELVPYDSEDKDSEDRSDMNSAYCDNDSSGSVQHEIDEEDKGGFVSEFGGQDDNLEAELQIEGNGIKELIDQFRDKLRMVDEHLEHLAGYPSTHLHLREIPGLETGNLSQLYKWIVRHENDGNNPVRPCTWGPERRGLMFQN